MIICGILSVFGMWLENEHERKLLSWYGLRPFTEPE